MYEAGKMKSKKIDKPGGKLVSVMSASVLSRENKKTADFRNFVDMHGYSERLSTGSFKESGANVNTCFVVLEKF